MMPIGFLAGGKRGDGYPLAQDIPAKLATVTSPAELDGFARGLEWQDALTTEARQAIATRRAELARGR